MKGTLSASAYILRLEILRSIKAGVSFPYTLGNALYRNSGRMKAMWDSQRDRIERKVEKGYNRKLKINWNNWHNWKPKIPP